MSQTLRVPSIELLSSHLPSPLMATSVMRSLWPANVRTCKPVSTSNLPKAQTGETFNTKPTALFFKSQSLEGHLLGRLILLVNIDRMSASQIAFQQDTRSMLRPSGK